MSRDTDFLIDLTKDREIYELEQVARTAIAEKTNPAIHRFREFLNNPKYIKQSGSKESNIISLGEIHRSFYIPEKDIHILMCLLEYIRIEDICEVSVAEIQNADLSGIMLDFDIYIKPHKSGIKRHPRDILTKEQYRNILECILSVISECVVFEKSYITYAAVTEKPEIVYKEDKKADKFGFHILIPGMQTSRQFKHYFIKKLIDDTDLHDCFKHLELIEKPEQLLDKNSAHVPVFLIGSTKKKGVTPYKLACIFELRHSKNNFNVTDVSNSDIFTTKEKTILCHEFSILYESQKSVIKKTKLNIREEVLKDLKEREVKADDSVLDFGSPLSMLYIQDADAKYVSDILDTLNDSRADDYKNWMSVMFILAGISKLYKPLAEKFSRRSSKFDLDNFNSTWDRIILSNRKGGLTVGTLHFWARSDNPERYAQVKNGHIGTQLYKKAYASTTGGSLNHSIMAKYITDLVGYKYMYEHPPNYTTGLWYEFIMDSDKHENGELWKWRVYEGGGHPSSMSIYICEKFEIIFKKILESIAQNQKEAKDKALEKYHKSIYTAMQRTIANMGNASTIEGIVKRCKDYLSEPGITNKMDKDENVIGVVNGILVVNPDSDAKQSPEYKLITGYHNYKITLYTSVPYKIFDPRDPATKQMLFSLKSIFPDHEADAWLFVLLFAASSLNGRMKDNFILILQGNGRNGKSLIGEYMLKCFEKYAVKMKATYLSSKEENANAPDPLLLSLKKSRIAVYSELDRAVTVNEPKFKEMLGQETLTARAPFAKKPENFITNCNHILSTNHKFTVNGSDDAVWARIKKYTCKVRFCFQDEMPKEPDPLFKPRNNDLNGSWLRNDDSPYPTAFFSILTWFYITYRDRLEFTLHNLNSPSIQNETEKYRTSQDLLYKFISSYVVSKPNFTEKSYRIPFDDFIAQYPIWYKKNTGSDLKAQDWDGLIGSSVLRKNIVNGRKNSYITGYRLLKLNESKEEDEIFPFKPAQIKTAEPVFSESAEEMYNRICKEYDTGIAGCMLPEALFRNEGKKIDKSLTGKPKAK